MWKRYNGINNGEIVYAVREAKKIKLGKNVAARALNDCIDKGFLRITQWSSFRLKSKEAREWAITALPIDGRPATKEFMRWELSKFETRSRQRDTQSRQRDSGDENDLKDDVSVPPAGPSGAKSAMQRSRQRVTSNIPYRSSPRFGDLARQARTARVPQSPRGEEGQQENTLIPPSGADDKRGVKRQWLMRRALAEAKQRLSPSNYVALESELYADGSYEAYLKRGSGALPPRLRDFFEAMFSVTQDAAPPTAAMPSKAQRWMPLPIDGGQGREPLPIPTADSPSMTRCAAALDRARSRTRGG